MHEYGARIDWRRGDQAFVDNRFSRLHKWTFDDGLEVPASSPPHMVPGIAAPSAAVDPEEAFVAALSSCHMLWFLAIAAARKYVVDAYHDEPVGVMEAIGERKQAITRVTLRPQVVFSTEKQPTNEELDAMHRKAHENCFLANSVKSEVSCVPVYR